MNQELFEQGLQTRREVLGAEYVDAALAGADELTRDVRLSELARSFAATEPTFRLDAIVAKEATIDRARRAILSAMPDNERLRILAGQDLSSYDDGARRKELANSLSQLGHSQQEIDALLPKEK